MFNKENNKRKKAAAAGAFVALAATAVLGGTFAQFTDSDTTEVQTLQAGTVQVDVTEGANWDTSGLLLAVDDTVERSFTVTNNGNLDIKGVNLTADVTATAGLDATTDLSEAVQVTISQDGVALAEDVMLDELASYALVFTDDLAPAATTELTFAYEVVATAGDHTAGGREDFATNPDNRFQGSSVAIEYTVDAVQRDGVPQ